MSINSQHRRGMMQLGVQALYVEDWCNLDTSNREGNEQEKHTWKQWPVGAPAYLLYIGDYMYYPPCCIRIGISHYKLMKDQLMENRRFGVAGLGWPSQNNPFHRKGIPGKQTSNLASVEMKGRNKKKHMLFFNVRRNITWGCRHRFWPSNIWDAKKTRFFNLKTSSI